MPPTSAVQRKPARLRAPRGALFLCQNDTFSDRALTFNDGGCMLMVVYDSQFRRLEV